MMQTHLERHPARQRTDEQGVDDAPLLLVHGLGGDRHSWTPVLPDLTAERAVVVVELPGFGASPPLPDDVEPSPVGLAAAVLRALDEAGIERVHVVGHSLGAWVALELADTAPGRVLSVVALTPAGFWPHPLEDRQGRAVRLGRRLAPLLPVLLAPQRVRDGVLRGVLGGTGDFGYRDAVAVVRGYVTATDYERTNRAMRRRVYDYPSRLAPLAGRVPVEVVWAALDRMVAPPRLPLPANVRVHLLPGAGHLPMFEQPRRCARLMLGAARRRAALERTP
jgi:pimeloyl-ACP methyl ester carboxylesterase